MNMISSGTLRSLGRNGKRMKRSREKQFVADARTLIQDTGLRRTAPRLAVLARMIQSATPLSHAELVEQLSPEGFDPITVYRNLVDLSGAGVLSRVDLGDHVWRFELRSNPGITGVGHPHFLCDGCGTVSCLPKLDIEISSAATDSPAIAEISSVVLHGRCDHCCRSTQPHP